MNLTIEQCSRGKKGLQKTEMAIIFPICADEWKEVWSPSPRNWKNQSQDASSFLQRSNVDRNCAGFEAIFTLINADITVIMARLYARLLNLVYTACLTLMAS